MPRHETLRTLCALPLLIPVALAHMQMQEPSPLRDPHSNRTAEPKDYNILTPLHPDGSDFACKSYQWNTPLTSVATYQAGKTYPLRLMGGATHGGGSCQVSLSCDYTHFNVIKSMEGNCPMTKEYEFTIPDDVPTAEKCLLAWTWFNKIGNREMYMNCAVVDLVGASSFSSSRQRASTEASSAAVAQAALSRYPDLYVANLKGVNDCVTRETTDVIFDNPGADVVYGDGLSASSSRIKRRTGSCTGAGRTVVASFGSDSSSSGSFAGSSSSSNSGSSSSSSGSMDGMSHSNNANSGSSSSSGSSGSSSSSGGSTGGDDGMWHPEKYAGSASSASSSSSGGDDGQWHPDVASFQSSSGGSKSGGSGQSQPIAISSGSSSAGSSSKSDSLFSSFNKAPSIEVEKALAAYLKSIGQDDDTSSVSPSEREDIPVPKRSRFSPQAVDTHRSSVGEFFQYSPDQGSDPRFRTQQIHSREPPDDEKPTSAPNAPEYDFVNHEATGLDDDSHSSSRLNDHSKTPSFEVEDSSSEAANKDRFFGGDDGDNKLPDFLKDLISSLKDENYGSDEKGDTFGGIYDRQKQAKKEKKKKKKTHSSSKAKHSGTKTSEDSETAVPEDGASKSEDAATTPTTDSKATAAPTPKAGFGVFGKAGAAPAVLFNGSFSALAHTAFPTGVSTQHPMQLAALFASTESSSITTESASIATEAIISLEEPSVGVLFTPVKPAPSLAAPHIEAPHVVASDFAAPGGACTPGIFLCNGEKQFWVCGQFGGDGWTYGALRDVSGGMTCKDGKIDRRSVDRRSVSKRGFGWYIGQDDSDWGSDDDDESPLDPIINAIDTLIKTVPRLATDKKKNQSDYATKDSDDWYQPYSLLRRKLGWWITNSSPSNEVPSNPLVTITDKLKKLESTLDWTISDLSASKNKNKSQKRSSGWWLSFGGDDTDDEGYASSNKNNKGYTSDKKGTNRDPLDDILWQVDDLSTKFDELKSLSRDAAKWKRDWGFFGQYGKDDMNKEVANGELGDPFEPILSKLKGYVRLVRGLLPKGKGHSQPLGGGYQHSQRPKYPWDTQGGNGWYSRDKRQLRPGDAGDGVSDSEDFEDIIGDGVFDFSSDEDDDDRPAGRDESEDESEDGPRRPTRPKHSKRPNRPDEDEDEPLGRDGEKSSHKAGNHSSKASSAHPHDDNEASADSSHAVPNAFDPDIAKAPNPFAPGGRFSHPGDSADGDNASDSGSDSGPRDFTTGTDEEEDRTADEVPDFFGDFDFDARRVKRRQDYGDDVQVPGFLYSDGGDGGNGIDGVSDAVESIFGKENDQVTAGSEDPDDGDVEDGKPSAKTPDKTSAAKDTDKDTQKDASKDTTDDASDDTDDEDDKENTGANDAAEEDSNDDDAAEEEEDDASNNATARKFKRDNPIPLPVPLPTSIPGFNFSDGSNGGDGVDEDPDSLFGSEPSDYEKKWGVAPEAEKQPQPSTTPVVKRDAPAPTGFTFSDGSNGGDGVEEDATKFFGSEPSDYESKWGVSREVSSAESTPLPLPEKIKGLKVFSPGHVKPASDTSRLEVGSPERYDWGEMRKRQAPGSSPTPPQDIIPVDPNTQAPADFTFSDGSKGGDGVDEEGFTEVFGDEPSDYEQKWGVDDKAVKNQTADQPDKDQAPVAPVSAVKVTSQKLASAAEAGAQRQLVPAPLGTSEGVGVLLGKAKGVVIPLGKAKGFAIRPRPVATPSPSAIFHGVAKPTPAGFIPGIGFKPVGKLSTEPVDIHDLPDAPVYLPGEEDGFQLISLSPAKATKAKSRPSEEDAIKADIGPSDALEEPQDFFDEPRPSFPPSVKAKAKPAPGFFDSLVGNPEPLEQANAVPLEAPEPESITGPIGKVRPSGPLGKASSSALSNPSGLDLTSDPSILDQDGGPGGFPPEPNAPEPDVAGVRPSVALGDNNSIETVSEEHIPNVSVAGPIPSLNSLGSDEDDDEIKGESDDDSEETDSEDADSEDDEDSNEATSANDSDSEDAGFDEGDFDENTAREKPSKHIHSLLFPLPARSKASTTTDTKSLAPTLASTRKSLSFVPWQDGIFPSPALPTGTDPSDADDDAVAVLPFFLGPGPVVPPGVTINWPGPFNLHHLPGFSAPPLVQVPSVQTPSTLQSVTVPVVSALNGAPVAPRPTATEAVFSAVGLPGVTGSWPPAVPGVTPSVGALKGAGLRRAVVERDRKEGVARA